MNNFILRFISLVFSVGLIFISTQLSGQQTFSYGTSHDEQIRTTTLSAVDQSILIGGIREHSDLDNGMITKQDQQGNLIWSQEYSHTEDMEIQDIHVLANGNLVVLARTINAAQTMSDFIMMETDPLGNVIWANTYIDPNYDIHVRKIKPMANGDYMVMGWSSPNNFGTFNFANACMYRLDSQGAIVWTVAHNQVDNSAYYSLVELPNGNLVVVGKVWFTAAASGNFFNGLIAEYDSNGNFISHDEYITNNQFSFEDILIKPDGNYAVIGNTSLNNTMPFASNRQFFTTINANTYVASGFRTYAPLVGGSLGFSFTEDPNSGNYFLCGTAQSGPNVNTRDNYWLEVSGTGVALDDYVYNLGSAENRPKINIDGTNLFLSSHTESLLADPTASANQDWMLSTVDLNNRDADCVDSTFILIMFGSLVPPPEQLAAFNVDNNFNLVANPVTLSVTDPTLSSATACAPPCEITVNMVQTNCDNQDTEDPFDDLITIEIVATAVSPGVSGSYILTDAPFNDPIGIFPYGLVHEITVPYSQFLTLTFTDVDISTCFTEEIFELTDCPPPCSIQPTITQINCNGMGTTDVMDDVITLEISTIGISVGPSATFELVGWGCLSGTPFGAFPYNTSFELEVPYCSSYNFIFTDSDDSSCSASLELDLSPCPPPCSIVPIVTQVDCDGMGTVDVNDDIIVLEIDATGIAVGTSYELVSWGCSNGTAIGTFDYNTVTTIDVPFCSVYTFIFTDADDNSCSANFEIDLSPCPPTCQIIPSVTQVKCSGMGTLDVYDDIITLEVFAEGVATGSSNTYSLVAWDCNGGTPLGVFEYNTTNYIDIPYCESVSFIFTDGESLSCSATIELDLKPCPPPCEEAHVSILLDNYPKETSWELFDEAGNVVESSNGHLGQNPNGAVLDWFFCLLPGCYEFVIYDKCGDGLCCDFYYGNGVYKLALINSNVTVATGAQFGFQESTSFCISDNICTNTNTLLAADFESGWDNWVGGGNNAKRTDQGNQWINGDYSIRLRRKGDPNASVASPAFDLSMNQSVSIDFDYMISGFEINDEFLLEKSIDDGLTWTIEETWNGILLNQQQIPLFESVVLTPPFSTTTKFRFRNNSNQFNDFVYLDKIVIKACENLVVAPYSVTQSNDQTSTVATDIESTEAIQSEQLSEKFYLYPNPAKQMVFVSFESQTDEQTSIEIFNIEGKLISQMDVKPNIGKNDIEMDIHSLAPGTYMVRIQSQEDIQSEKLIITE